MTSEYDEAALNWARRLALSDRAAVACIEDLLKNAKEDGMSDVDQALAKHALTLLQSFYDTPRERHEHILQEPEDAAWEM